MWRRQWQPTPVLLPGKSHGQRSLVGCSPWRREKSNMTEQLHFHSSLSCIGEGNGKPFQRSCLENPRDRGAWWAAVYGVTQSQTRLKRLRSSSNPVCRAPSMTQRVKNTSSMQETKETQVQSLGQENSLEKEMVTHFSILAWNMGRGAWRAIVMDS